MSSGAQLLWARRVDSFVKLERVSVAVAAVSTVLFAPINIRGFESAIVFLDNDGADTLDGVIEYSPDGVYPGTVEEDATFADMAPGGPTRWVRIPAHAQWFRVSASFATTPGNVRVSVMLQRGA